METTIITLSHTRVGNDTQETIQHMTSLEIAELTGKQHCHVMEAIRKMEPAWMKIAESNFRLGSYEDANGQLRPCYSLTKTELSQEDNLKWAADLLQVEFDKGAKDITRVFFTTTASEEDLLYLDDRLFETDAAMQCCSSQDAVPQPSALTPQPSFDPAYQGV